MKNRSFMSGLGIGLIIGAILLQLMIMGEGQVSTTTGQSTDLTREQIEEKAKAMDLKVTESSEQLLTKEEWQQQKKELSVVPETKSTQSPTKAKPAIEPVQPSSPEQPEKKNESTPSKVQPPQAQSTSPPKTPVTPTKEKVTQAVEYKIKKGSNLTTIADDLEKIGVIGSSDQFIKQAVEQKINRKIRDGSYTFIKGESIESIISKIRIQSSR
ncbi:hypothetical protein [Paenibacillus macquariensis]|uniref:YceG-like family protein n=1 Tax=Paenibacillus macquariensis TaxID=948756 RepID=A0ABY1JZV5_9BACL|nr:hypothetical protein [Paenibacillus macquariensis]MEC0091377.1 hypothetical protein [Paenibacillus macquariensis]OAB38060.1 hypothetical protein PMSM_02680 [Paenibacillus macquariensis subsp. macquariensis]SIR05450.1 hypothetical protein SAMN05421578_106187 [Paenibacillus macquariensis]